MWQLREQHEMKRLSRLRASAKPGPRPRSTLPAGTDLLPQIRHIVVLMMENHSYDNYLGMLQGRGEGFPLGPDSKPAVSNLGAGGKVIRAEIGHRGLAIGPEREAFAPALQQDRKSVV